MADISDVVAALADLCDAALYPNGDGSPSAAGGAPVKIIRGWPNNAALNADLAATPPISTVSIYPMPGMTRAMPNFFPQWTLSEQPAATITATAGGSGVTFSGTVSTSQIVGVLTGGIGYAYRPSSSDTLATLAAAFAGVIQGASSAGALLTTPAAVTLAEVYADTTGSAEVGRQRDGFQISIWAPDDATRASIATVLQANLDGQDNGNGGFTYRIALPDGSEGILCFTRSYIFDVGQIAGCYRRDLIYTVEYPTILTRVFPSLLFLQTTLQVGAGEAVTIGPLQPVDKIMQDAEGNVLMTGAGLLFSSQ